MRKKRCSGPSSSRREADPCLCLQWHRCPSRPAPVKLCQWSSHDCLFPSSSSGPGRHHRLHHPPGGMHRSSAVKGRTRPFNINSPTEGSRSARRKRSGRALNKGRVIQSMRYQMHKWKHCSVEALSRWSRGLGSDQLCRKENCHDLSGFANGCRWASPPSSAYCPYAVLALLGRALTDCQHMSLAEMPAQCSSVRICCTRSPLVMLD